MKVGSTWMLGFVLALALAVPAAARETKTVSVPAEALVLNGNAPDDPGNCSAVVFVKWKDVPGTTAATAFWTSDDQARSQASAPPFDDVYQWVATYTVEPGFHWIAVGKSWQDGPVPSDCSELRDRIKAKLDPVARVELKVPAVDAKACSSAKKTLAARKKAVRKARHRLADASGKKAKKRLKGKLKKAKAKRDKAAARVKKRC